MIVTPNLPTTGSWILSSPQGRQRIAGQQRRNVPAVPTMFSVTPVCGGRLSMRWQHRRHWQSASFVEMLKGNGNGTLQGSIDYVATDGFGTNT